MPIMLRLKNIKVENGVVEADFYPENSVLSGHIAVDVQTEEVISCKRVEGFGESYEGHAKNHLIRMAKQNKVEKERLVMWH